MQESLESAFLANGDTVIDEAFWNRFVRELAARFRGLEGIKISWAEVSRQGIDLALDRINETIGPAAERIRRLTELGFLVAASETPATLEVGAILQLEVTAGDTRDLFAPSPFLLLGRTLSAADYAVVKLRTYDAETGALELEVVTVAGDPGPHADWSIGALAGSTLAQLTALDQGRDVLAETLEARDASRAARDTAGQHRAATQADREAVTALRADALAFRNTAGGHATAAGEQRTLAEQAAAAAAASAASLNAPAINAAILLAEQRAAFLYR